MTVSLSMDFPSDEKELRRRIRLLGSVLARVLKTEAGAEVAATFEQLLRGFMGLRRDGGLARRQHLFNLIEPLQPEVISTLAQAFKLYFSLVNSAEESHYLRLWQRWPERDAHFGRSAFHDTLLTLKQSGVRREMLQVLLDELLYQPVMTAHPSEAEGRTMKDALRNIFLTNERLDDSRVRGGVRQEERERLHSQIQLLWKSEADRAGSMGVAPEIDADPPYFSPSLFQATTRMYRTFERSLNDVYGAEAYPAVASGAGSEHMRWEAGPIRLPSFLRFCSWIEGESDGNPNVEPAAIARALRLQARTILQEYVRRLAGLRGQLPNGFVLCPPSAAFLASLKDDRAELGGSVSSLEKPYLHEPYRHKLVLMAFRMEQTLAGIAQRLEGDAGQTGRHAYPSPAAFLADLATVHKSLNGQGDAAIAAREVQNLIRLTETFGFHLMQMDVRQESGCHTEAVAEILAAVSRGSAGRSLSPDYRALDEATRLEVLSEAIRALSPVDGVAPYGLVYHPCALSEATRETLEVFHVMARMRREIGSDCFGRYVIAMTHAASHVLEVLLLAVHGGLAGRSDGHWYCHLGVSLSFESESIDNFDRIESVFSTLLDIPLYRELLKASGRRQEIIFRHGDSCTDNGILASAWTPYRAQQKIVAIFSERGLMCRLFHDFRGRGGPLREAILAQPPGTLRGQIKFTEPGEVLPDRYDNVETAVHELTMGVTSLLEASVSLVQPMVEDRPQDLLAMDELTRIGEHAYRDLTEYTEGFLDYFCEATPAGEIDRFLIASRPWHCNKRDRSRQSAGALAWAQSRQTLPAWYGIGASLSTWCAGKHERLERLQAMYRDWPFFRNVLTNAQRALSKADMSIAREYAGLCADPDTGERIYRLLANEYQCCVDWILDTADTEQLLAENPTLAASLNRRAAYLGPLNYLQVVLLRRTRAAARQDPAENRWLQPLFHTINAIEAGMRDPG